MPSRRPPAVLVYTQTAGYRHVCIPKALSALRRLGRENGFAVEATEDPMRIRGDVLEGFGAIAFVNTSGNVLDFEGREAMQAFVEGGGGFAGVHAACDTGYDWPWYGGLVGAWFLSHPLQRQNAIVRIEDGSYGYCHLCRRPIERERLEIVPQARYCARCQQVREAGR